jgi:hypothetical protein
VDTTTLKPKALPDWLFLVEHTEWLKMGVLLQTL